MRILVQNLRSLPYSLDIGETMTGDIVRALLAPKDQPGDTAEIGEYVDPWDLNMRERVRALVVPPGATRIITPVSGGYSVTANPPGQVKVTFLEDPDDLVFLFFGGSGGDGKVYVDGADTTKDFLAQKLAPGVGISFTVLNPGGNEQLRIDTTGSSGLTPEQHEILRQLIHFLDEGPGHGFANPVYKVVTGGLFPTRIDWFVDAGLTLRVFSKLINRTGPSGSLVKPNPITYIVYQSDGTTPAQTATDTVTYSGIAEVGRTRVFT